MPRIRTIKPEFPQSESMGRVSRDARLTFIQLWTLADDSGRLRGNSRMLASLLFPYDDDAPGLIDGWLAELEREGCIVRYKVEGDAFIAIAKWLSHQKIDKPTASKNPAPEEGSRILANPRESSPLDQGSRTKDQGEDQERSEAKASGRRGARLSQDWSPSDEDMAFAKHLLNGRSDSEVSKFRDYWVAQPGQKGVKLDWSATWRNWCRNAAEYAGKSLPAKSGSIFDGAL